MFSITKFVSSDEMPRKQIEKLRDEKLNEKLYILCRCERNKNEFRLDSHPS